MVFVIAIVSLSIWIVDAVKLSNKAARYRRKAEWAERMERRSREIDAMDPATRAKESEAEMDNPFLIEPEWNRRMIPYLEGLKRKYRYAAENPREPVAPDPPPVP